MLARLEPGTAAREGVIVRLRTSDAAALCKTLKEWGVPIVKDLQESSFGMTFSLQDPDGRVLSVHDERAGSVEERR